MKLFKRTLKFNLVKPWRFFTRLEVKLPFYRNKENEFEFSTTISLEKTATNKYSVFIYSEYRDVFYNKPFETKSEAKKHYYELLSSNSKLWDELQKYNSFLGDLNYSSQFESKELKETFDFKLTDEEIITLNLLNDEIVNSTSINSFYFQEDDWFYAQGFINCMKLSMQRKKELSDNKDKK